MKSRSATCQSTRSGRSPSTTRQGFFEKNKKGIYSVNSVTAATNDDGSTTIRFGGGDKPNTIPIMDGWNYAVRMYRPRKEILDGTWTFPTVSATV